ncbi:MAG TPA: hypothetical protein VHG31_00230 [Stellaceae bacterium]|nr:hypothetical protein [Stellaceae bacterium]
MRDKVWLSLGVALVTGASLGGGAIAAVPETGHAVAGVRAGHDPSARDAVAPSLWIAQHARPAGGEHGKAGEGGEGGKAGEGGERGGAANLTRSDAAYLTQLGLIRGHLDVGTELYRIGDQKTAVTHMKHPEDELYAALKPALARRGAPGFDNELKTLADKVEKNAGPSEVEAAYNSLLAAIAKAESAVAKPTAPQIGEVIHNLVRTAAAEYSEALEDGRIVEAHEYQDALGFVRVAENWLAKLKRTGADPSIVTEIEKQIASIKPAWTGVVPPKTAPVDLSRIHSAAARIEIATLGLKD